MTTWSDQIDGMKRGLQTFAAHQMPSATDVGVDELVRIPGGGSRETWSFQLRWKEDGRPRELACVMQRSPDGGLLNTDREREFHIIKALNSTHVPAPRAVWLDAAGKWLERPFFITEKVNGRVGGRFLLEPEYEEVRRALAPQFVGLAAKLHTVDWTKLNLPLPDVPTCETTAFRQVAEWESVLDKDELEPQPVLREAFRWMKAHAPVADRLTLNHGDFKFENLLFEGDRITALLDWEMVHVGDPMEDLAWTYRWYMRLTDRIIPQGEYLRLYQELTGHSVNQAHLDFYRVFTNVKASIIGLTGMRAFVDGFTKSNPNPGGTASMAIDTMARLNRLRQEMETEVRAQ